MTERVDFRASSSPLQSETVPPPLKPSPAGGRWRLAPDEGQHPLAPIPPQSRYTRQSLQQAVYRLIYQFVAFCERTDISTGRNSHVFCAIDISVQTEQLLAGGERAWEKKEAEENGSAQKITGETVNVTGIIEIFAVLPLLHPRFLCKSLKYTSCTVFQRKFIHFGKDVELHAKTRAIFVRFYPVSL